MRGRRPPLVDIAAIKRDVLAVEAESAEQLAARTLLGTELAVLWAFLTRYELELFESVELDDFFVLPNKALFGELRNLEAAGKIVDGELLPGDIAARLEEVDRSTGKELRRHFTDQKLQTYFEPPAWVVRPPDRASIQRAVERLQVEAHCRRACPLSASDAGELAGVILRRLWGRA